MLNSPTTFLLLVTIISSSNSSSSSNCPPFCTCKYQTVECIGKGLSSVPEGIDPDTRILDLSGNTFPYMEPGTFHSAGLINVQKLFVNRCRIRIIPGEAFRGLQDLLELDLSRNMLKNVPGEALLNSPRLIKLNLAENQIKSLLNGDFPLLRNLEVLELTKCQITEVHRGAFAGLTGLQWLDLSGNLLEVFHPDLDVLSGSLKGVQLHNNPWNCSCQLRPFNRWLKRSIVPVLVNPVCEYPEELRKVPVKDLEISECSLNVVQSDYYFEAEEGGNVTLFCQIDPSSSPANLTWYFQDEALPTTPTTPIDHALRYFIKENNHSSTLFIYGVNSDQNGTFYCVAENVAGVASANYTIMIIPTRPGPEKISKIFPGNNRNSFMPLAFTLGAVMGALCLVALGMFAIKRHSKKNNNNKRKIPKKSILKQPSRIRDVTEGNKRANGDFLLPGQEAEASGRSVLVDSKDLFPVKPGKSNGGAVDFSIINYLSNVKNSYLKPTLVGGPRPVSAPTFERYVERKDFRIFVTQRSFSQAATPKLNRKIS
ncbi:leucine-rich repeat-containing protein 24-like isoform X2 [Anthonomus grandis grandis]|nr:leucine-rich repeat-containing protein 24-like isoform X2 [Anthonomus grandis grandis]